MYFGLHFAYSNINIEVSTSGTLPRTISTGQLESFDLSRGKEASKVLIKQIKDDVAMLNSLNVGSKEWKLNEFELFDGVYVYRHACHVSCSHVTYSHIEKFMSVSATDYNLDIEAANDPCSHSNHYRLEPFFFDNLRLKHLFSNMDDDEAKQLLTELNGIDEVSRSELQTMETEFFSPAARYNNWDEDDWTTRLHVGLKKTFQLKHTFCGVGLVQFRKVMDFLNVSGLCDRNCFLFRGIPDIILQNKGIVMNARDRDEDGDTCSSSESDLDATVENSWQRNPLKGASDTLPSQKLGEVIAGLYILLVAKIVRRINKKKNFHKLFKVRGVLIDKACMAVGCTLTVDLTHSISELNVTMCDYLGHYNTRNLCYLIRKVLI